MLHNDRAKTWLEPNYQLARANTQFSSSQLKIGLFIGFWISGGYWKITLGYSEISGHYSDRKFGNDGKTCYFCIVMAAHNELGAWGEELAASYLQRKGYEIVERNWKSGHRDIDIIAMDGSVMVFVEVKTRRNRMFVEPEEAIDYMKLRNLRASINHYVKFKHISCDIRLDAITIVGTPENGSPDIDHIVDFPIY